MKRSPKGGWKLVVHIAVALAEGGSILVFQTVSPTRKAVVADRHNPIAVITLSPTLIIDLIILKSTNVRDRVMTVGLVMTVWNIKTAHKRNLLKTSMTIPTVITLSLTLVIYYNYLYIVGSN